VSQSAILRRSDVPSREALQEALKTLKFKLTLDESYVPLESSGYLPCTINGEDGGFDIRFDRLETYLGKYAELESCLEQRDTLISLRWSGDPREEVCALMVAAALAQGFDAIVHDPKKNVVITAEKATAEARAKFSELD
jgi:hypothetical protein